MRRFLQPFDLGVKIGMGFGVVILLFAWGMVSYQTTLTYVLDTYRSVIARQEAIKDNAEEIQTHLLQARRSEKDFIIRKDIIYLNLFKKAIEKVLEHINAYELLRSGEEHFAGKREADSFLQLISIYESNFTSVVALMKRVGLDRDSGHQKTLQETIAKLETILSQLDVAELLRHVLQAQIAAKNFQLETSGANLQKVVDLVEQLLVHINETPLERSFQPLLREKAFQLLEMLKIPSPLTNNRQQVIAAMEGNLHSLAEMVSRPIPPASRTLLMEIRMHEQEFLNGGDMEDLRQMKKDISTLASALSHSDMLAGDKTVLVNHLNQVDETVDLMVQDMTTLDVHLQTLRQAAHQVEPLVGKKVNLAMANKKQLEEKMAAEVDRRVMISLLVALVAVVLGVLIASLISRRLGVRLASLTRQANRISHGLPLEEDQDLFADASQPGDELHRLSIAFGEIYHTFHGLTQQAKAVAAEDFSTRIVPRSEQDEMSHALMAMTLSLRQGREFHQRQIWLKEGLSLLEEGLRGHLDVTEVASISLNVLVKHVAALVGAVFLRREDYFLQVAAHGLSADMMNEEGFSLGEGLAGQVALTGQPLRVTDVPQGYMPIKGGLGSTNAACLAIIPLVRNQQTMGLLELAAFTPFSDQVMEVLAAAGSQIAVALEVAIFTQRQDALLTQTRDQAAELEEQHLELEETNRQLEMQAQELEEGQLQIESYNRQLEMAQGELEEHIQQLEISNKYKMEFLANMSHELRTPLNSILLLSRLMLSDQGGGISEEHRRNLSVISNAGTDLLTLIEQVLDHAKIEAGKFSLHWEQVDLSEMVRYLLDSFKIQMAHVGLTYTCRLVNGVTNHLVTDRNRLLQVLRNFLANALKFTQQGEITVTVLPASRDMWQEAEVPGAFRTMAPHASNFVAMVVTDSGIGIPKDKQQIVFDAFQQVDGTINRKYSGTGLGLAISLKIAEALGGGLILKSIEGAGSSFSLLLPIQPPEESQPAAEVVAEEPSQPLLPSPVKVVTQPPGAGEKRLLLIIEDDRAFAEVLATQGRRQDYDILTAVSGSEGLRLAQLHIPHAILMDIGLPVMNGWEVLRQLKKNAKTRHIPVHIISGEDESHFAYRLGAVDYLVKPVLPEDLTRLFRRIEEQGIKRVRRLLVVADDVKCKGITDLVAGGDDLEVVEATTGVAAMEMLQQGHFDCVVVDMALKDTDSFHVLEKIKEISGQHHIPTVVCTAKTLTLEEENRLRHLSDSIVMKTAESRARLLEETAIFLHRVDTQLRADQRQLLSELKPTELLFENKNVLLVDDDVRNTYAMTVVLEKHGLQVVPAVDGQEALNILFQSGQRIDFVLMDIMMPHMDGLTAIRRIRSDPRFYGLPIVVLTAKAMVEDRENAIQAGASDYLTKPVDYDQFFSLLRIWLAASQHDQH